MPIDCEYRTPIGTNGQAQCALVASLSGVESALCIAEEPACEYCQRHQPNTPDRPNDMVASLVLGAVRKHAPERWQEARGKYQRFLKVSRPAPQNPNAAPCHHRGAVLRTQPCTHCSYKGEPRAVYECPKHGECSVHREKFRIGGGPTGEMMQACAACADRQPDDAKPVTIRVGWSPGDNVVATAAVYEIHRQFPARFAMTIRTHYPQVWDNNPAIVGVQAATNEDDGDDRWINLSAMWLLNRSWNRPVHYLESFVYDLRKRLDLPDLELTEFRGHVYLSEDEKRRTNQVESATGDATRPWWILNAGGKSDCTCKLWPVEHWQAVVDHFRGRVRFVQVGAFDKDSGGHVHPALEGVVDLRGKTDHAQLRQLVWHCDGVVCANTYLMHLAAAVDNPPWRPSLRPCVVIAGGRENVHWFQYPGHTILHRIGALGCCGLGGCWKDRVIPINDGRLYNAPGKLCQQPAGEYARCMAETGPAEVIASVEKHLQPMEQCSASVR